MTADMTLDVVETRLHAQDPNGDEAPLVQDSDVRQAVPPVVVVGAVLVITAGIAFRFLTRSELWLDEALSVNVAHLPLSELPETLRHDGSPPLYYVLLHFWTRVFGEGNVAVRALGGVASVATLPLMWFAGRRLGGRRTAWAATLLLAVSPFAIAFASQTRMYSLVTLLSVAGFLFLHRFLDRPRWRDAVGIACVTGLLALTHYWAFYLIGAVLLALGIRFVLTRGEVRRTALLAMVAMASGGMLFLPWLRSFVYQLRYTGTPWARPARFDAVFNAVSDFSGGVNGYARLVLVCFIVLGVIGVFAGGVDGRRVYLDLLPNPRTRGMAFVALGSLYLGLIAGLVSGGAYAARYASIAIAPFLLVVAFGAGMLLDRRVRYGVLVVVLGCSTLLSWRVTNERRTQAAVVADKLMALAKPGDVIGYCPDQLGPAVDRLLPEGRFQQITFPRMTGPRLVDWAEYEKAQKFGNPTGFALELDRLAGDGHDVWFVLAPGYRTFKNYCEIVHRDLGDMRPLGEMSVKARPSKFGETQTLMRYPASCRLPLERAMGIAEPSPMPGPSPAGPNPYRQLRCPTTAKAS